MAEKSNMPEEPGTRIKRFDRPGQTTHRWSVEDESATRWILDRFHRLMGRESMFWQNHGEGLGAATLRGLNYFDLTDTGARTGCLDAYGKENYRTAKWLHGLAQREEGKGRKETACNYYFRAAATYLNASWGIFDSDSEELKFYREKINECYKKVVEFAPYPIERVEIPFDGNYMPAYWHMTPGREKAPTILYCGGMDQRKEIFVNPSDNHYVKRGMNVLALEGPGQGESAERKLFHDTPDKFGKAGKVAIDWLVKRKEVDPEKIGIYGNSMGSYWGASVAIEDSRVKAVALAMSCYYPATGGIFTETAPNFRDRFMWMADKNTDEEWNEYMSQFTLEGKEHLVKCPLIMFAGEMDHLCNINQTYQFWRRAGSQVKELRIYAGQYHAISRFIDEFDLNMSPDWLRERLLNKPVEPPEQKVLLVDNWKNEKPVNIEALEKGWAFIEG